MNLKSRLKKYIKNQLKKCVQTYFLVKKFDEIDM
jgi:hypothetical protein